MAFIDDLKELIKKYDDSETVEKNDDSETVEKNDDLETTVYTEQREMVVKNIDGKKEEEEKTIHVNEQGEYYYV